MGNVRLSELFHITERFQRSVHLERDFYTENALDGYVVTVKARETLTRLIEARQNRGTSKAWTLRLRSACQKSLSQPYMTPHKTWVM